MDTEIGQTIIDILTEILPPNPDRVMELDEKTGQLFIQDTPSNHKIISNVIKAIDEEPAQIEIETRFVELRLTDTDEFSFNWGDSFLWNWWGPAPDVSPAPPESVPGQKVPYWRVRGINPNTGAVDDLITFANTTTAGLDLSMAKLNTTQLDIFLHALEQSEKANLLSSPKVTTIGGQLATIMITQTYPYVVNQETTVEEDAQGKDVPRYDPELDEKVLGIKLNVKPTVGEAGIIMLELNPIVEQLTDRYTVFDNLRDREDDLGWPVVDIRSAQTTVQVKSGETVVMGGLMRDDHNVREKKVPVLGDIPLLGNLFRRKYVEREKRNLLIFVTATLVNPAGEKLIK